MNASTSLALSESLFSGCSSSEELGSEELTGPESSPELKRSKRPKITRSRLEGMLNCTFPPSLRLRSLNKLTEHESRMSFKSVQGESSLDSPLGPNARSSFSSLPEMSFPESSTFVPTNEGSPAIESVHNSSECPSTELRKDRKTRVVSSYYTHLKAILAQKEDPEVKNELDQGQQEEMTEMHENEGISIPHQRGEGESKEILEGTSPLADMGASEETDAVEGMSSSGATVSLATSRHGIKADQVWEGVEGDATRSLGSSPVEKQFKNELEFSTILTLAYVRVRDLTNNIDKAAEYLASIEKIDETDEVDDLRAKIHTLFDSRATLAMEHAKWRAEFTEHYRRRKKFLGTLKTRATYAEKTYFTLRKELETVQNEPVAAKPRRGWFSRICGWSFVK